MTSNPARPRPATPPSEPIHTIWFDCDSTLSHIEGIDELALRAGPETAERVARLTNEAMDGGTPLEEVYAARLEAIRPDRAACEAIGTRYVQRVVPDARQVCEALRSLGKRLGIVSGGLLPCVAGLAEHLGVEPARVHAVGIRFAADGSYDAFDHDSPLARSGGKPELLRTLAGDSGERSAFVGDGVTDLETAPVVDRFVGFGGVVRRPLVADAAEHWAEGPGLATALPHLLTTTELASLRTDASFGDLLPGGRTAGPD